MKFLIVKVLTIISLISALILKPITKIKRRIIMMYHKVYYV